MIPDFVHYADAPPSYSFLLPEGMHICDLAEVEQKMVKPFATSTTRKPIFEGLGRYISDCQTHGISGRIWLDGSFVTGKNNPGDVDVVSLVSADLLKRLNPLGQTFALDNLNVGKATKPKYDVHSFGVLSVQPPGEEYLKRAVNLAGWINFFRSTKEFVAQNGMIVEIPKGILQVDFGESSEIAAIAQWFQGIQKEVTL